MARGKPPRRGGSSKSKWVPSSPYAIAAFLVGLIGALAMWFGGDDAGPEPPRGAAQAGLDACVDKAADCKTWAQQGECTINAEYMHTNCRAACGLCPAEPSGRPSGGDRGRVDRRYMCSRAPDERPILAPGTMGRVFQDAVDRFPQYKPTIHSTDPWVVTFDELFSEEEAKRIFELGAKGMARSASVAGIDENGQFKKQISDVRTSENSWCVDSDCGTDPVVRRVTQRIAEITQSSPKSFELYQVLRYAPGEYYRQHHDWVDAHTDFPFGPRVYTFFLYLSDVEEGGGTAFPGLNITVHPKLGRALWWPSVLADQPEVQDPRTNHEAQPVIRGTKMAANVWIHLYDFMTPYMKGCAP